ncbi:MAG: hypothetical protein ACRDQ0_15180 [Pseudonocardia sp.]
MPLGGTESVEGVWLRLAAEPGAAWLVTHPGRTTRFRPRRTACVVEHGSLALVQFRSEPEPELGVLAFGPHGADLTDRVIAAVHLWDRDRSAVPDITLHPAGTPDDELPPGAVIDKHHRRVVLAHASHYAGGTAR